MKRKIQYYNEFDTKLLSSNSKLNFHILDSIAARNITENDVQLEVEG